MTMTLIATATAPSTQSSLDFATIPATYTDLFLVISDRATVTDASLFIKFNGSSSSYNIRRMLGFGSGSAISQTIAEPIAGLAQGSGYTSNTFGNTGLYIPNYAGSTNKSWSSDSVNETNATSIYLGIIAGRWSNTAAITSIALTVNGGSFAAGSTASLYGILKGSGGATVS